MQSSASSMSISLVAAGSLALGVLLGVSGSYLLSSASATPNPKKEAVKEKDSDVVSVNDDTVYDSIASIAPRSVPKVIVGTIFQKLIFLGTGSAVPSPGKYNTSGMAFLLSSGNIIMLDCGEASQHQMMKCASLKSSKVKTILITHLHGDHTFGLFGFLCTAGLHDSNGGVTIVGPKGIKRMVLCCLSVQAGAFFQGFPLHFVELEGKDPFADLPGGCLTITDGVQLRAKRIEHCSTLHTYAYSMTEVPKLPRLNNAMCDLLQVAGPNRCKLKLGEPVLLNVPRALTLHSSLLLAAVQAAENLPAQELALLLKNNEPKKKKKEEQPPADEDMVSLLLNTCEESVALGVIAPLSRPRTVCVVQDTKDASAAEDICRNADLLVHECTYENANREEAVAHGHSTSEMAGQFAKKVGAKLLVLSHFSTRYPRYASYDKTKLPICWRSRKDEEPMVNNKSVSKKKVSGGSAEEREKKVDVCVQDLVAEAKIEVADCFFFLLFFHSSVYYCLSGHRVHLLVCVVSVWARDQRDSCRRLSRG